MPRKKRIPLTLFEKLQKMKRAGLQKSHLSQVFNVDADPLEELDIRLKKILGIFQQHKPKTNRMLYFVMYDIEDNKVRTYISKFLINKGCIRIQKSVFIADSERSRFAEINRLLLEVQAFYENEDSIFMIPISSDEIRAMKIIGKNVDFSYFLESPNTLIF